MGAGELVGVLLVAVLVVGGIVGRGDYLGCVRVGADKGEFWMRGGWRQGWWW